ncbi:hypothetical protein [Cephaloticoccus primus]|nr:hypothetical protein [Cephaloticoccus primus]
MKINKIAIIYTVIGLTFFSYALVRAIKVGVTYDEVVTLQEFVPQSLHSILFKASPIANNHMLNTVVIKFLFLSGNESLFWARVPGLVSLLMYIYFSYRLLLNRLPHVYGVGCFALLICNPFMLEFFSLARGYGMSFAFMMGALYFASQNIEDFSVSSLYKSLGFGAFSVLSIFSMVYFELALALTLNIAVLLKKDRRTLKQSLLHSFLVGIILLLVIAVPIFRLEKHRGLSYGGECGVYRDTLMSLARYSLGDFKPSSLAPLLLNSFLLISVAGIGFSFFRKWRAPMSGLFVGVTILSVSLIILAHHLAGVKYPIDRVGLFLYPLMILSLCFCLYSLGRWVSMSLLAVLVSAFFMNFISRANFYKTTLWDFDAHTTQILEMINAKGQAEGQVMALEIESVFEKSVSYYIDRNRYNFIRVLCNHGDAKGRESPRYFLYFSQNVFPDADFVKHDRDRLPHGLSEGDIFIEYPDEKIIIFGELRGSLNY